MPTKYTRTPGSPEDANANEAERRSLLDANSDEDFFLMGPKVKTDKLRGDSLLPKKLQGQVDEVVDIMRTSVTRALDRGDKFDDLDGSSGRISTHSEAFQSMSKTLDKEYKWQNIKMKIGLGCVIIIVVGAIITALAVHFTTDYN